ncbi:MAG: hypothetical protein RL017_623 [Pseudomonadota bacterium]|jgi:hypothetical protein|nr:DUF2782 domain-containing protein [Burkholderiales bacterium]
MIKIYSKTFLLASCCLVTSGCSFFTPTPSYPTIPLAPPKPSQSNVSPIILPNIINNESKFTESSPPKQTTVYKNSKIISEERSNGQVTQIKVQNGKDIPDYYIYPSQQQSINSNNAPGKNLATPSWQISW